MLQTINSGTKITYHTGSLSENSTIVFITHHESLPEKAVIITEETPFHPMDYSWADQPGDIGTITTEDAVINVVDTLTGAINAESGKLFLGKDIPVRKGTTGWFFVVVHVVDSINTDIEKLQDQTVHLEVDKQRRLQLSANHTSAHLMALAFNKHAAKFWRKAAPRNDSLNSPDLDQLSVQKSQITTTESLDHYRFGKSLRKKGFNSADFVGQLKDIEQYANATIAGWLTSDKGLIAIETSGHQTLETQRVWKCELPEGIATMPCGGTHLTSLSQLDSVTLSFKPIEGTPEEIKVHTVAKLRNAEN